MPKSRLNFTVDPDVAAWLDMAIEQGERSRMVNEYFRFMMQTKHTDKSEKDLAELNERFKTLQEEHKKIINEMTMVQHNIEKIKKSIDQRQDDEVKDLVAKRDMLIQSGEWEAMLR